jgi:hypothetical protein
MKLSQAASKVIALAEAIRTYWDRELPKRHPNYPLVNAGEDSGPPPPEEKKLRALLAKLPEDTVYRLALLMYLGRGDFGTEDLPGHFDSLRRALGDKAAAANRLADTTPLADYLSDGLAELNNIGIDVDRLAFSAVKAAK